MHKLRITNYRNHIEEITLTNGNHTIGRSLDSNLRLEGDEVSRLHARLLVNPTQCELIDGGSKNGTFINGNRIASSYLYNNDIIQIGRFNLQFISDTAKPHRLWKKEKTGIKITFIVICLVLGFIFLAGLFLYQKKAVAKTKTKLAERTAQYLAERNKEALYLGEYNSINLTNLPAGVIQIAVFDRNGKLRAYHPSGTEPAINVRGDASDISRYGDILEIYTPIYYESTQVGTLWMKYKL